MSRVVIDIVTNSDIGAFTSSGTISYLKDNIRYVDVHQRLGS